MHTFLVAVISLIALLLIVIILLQSAKGGGLAAEFGGASSSTDSIIGGRQAATVLTKGTWIGAGVFLFLAVLLAILSARQAAPPESILRGEFGQPAESAPTSVLESETLGGVAPAEEGDGESTPAQTGPERAGEPAPPE